MFHRPTAGLLLAICTGPALADVYCVATPAQFDQAIVNVLNAATPDHEVRLLRDTTLQVGAADFPSKVTRYIILTQAKNLLVSGGWEGTPGTGTCPQQTALDPASSVIDAGRYGTVMAVILGGEARVTLSNLTLRDGQDDTPGDYKPGCLRANLLGSSRLEVNRVRLEGCAALGDPGGLQVSMNGAEFVLSNSIVTDAYADFAGGVSIDLAMVGGAATLSNNTIIDAEGEAATSAVRVSPGVLSSVQLRNNVVRALHANVIDLEIAGLSDKATLVRNHYDTAMLGVAVSSAVSNGDPGLSADFTPSAGSLLIDSGVEAASGPLDYRGAPRVAGVAIDVGAIETEASDSGAEIFRSGFEE
jgi:hypothetical protein